MSFSSDLKDELGTVFDAPRHCRLAELAAFVLLMEEPCEDPENILVLSSENRTPILAAWELLRKLTGTKAVMETEERTGKRVRWLLKLPAADETEKILEALKENEEVKVKDLTVRQCCKKAFLRGAFISAGTVSDPDKSYHLEYNCRTSLQKEYILEMMNNLHIHAKSVKRGKYYSVYIKDSEQIVEFAGQLGARVGLLDMENARIVHYMKGNINRRVNCETANINKTATASARQIDDIEYIRDHGGFTDLPNGLDEIARVRLQYPEATLIELGQMLRQPLGKSGVNHRLRKLCGIAEAMRNEKGLTDGQKTGRN